MITDKINSNNRNKCTGCYACASICPIDCIDMLTDEEGFWYPKVNANCIECGKCIDVCHIFNNNRVNNEPIAFACVNKDETIRIKSSSGGVFYELSKYVLSQEGVVFGASFNNNFYVQHTCVENISEIKLLQGSKYVQSKIDDAFKKVELYLRSGRRVLFSGTPCQIGGLKSYLQKSYKSLICVDIVCHGVPSPLVWRNYLEYQEKTNSSKIQDVIFRIKDKGWRQHSIKLIFKNQNIYQRTIEEDLYLRAFLKDICLRPSCYSCDFKTLNRQSDITLADFWGIENICPELDDNRGTSLVFINSKKGEKTFDSIKKFFSYKEVDINLSVKYNPSAINASSQHPKRTIFFSDIHKFSFEKVVRKNCKDSVFLRSKNIFKGLVIKILNILGIKLFIKSVLVKL